MKVMFLDESGDHSLTKVDTQFPVFCLAGCIFDELEYTQKSNAQIDAFKIRYFNKPDIILHSREIRKCEPPFNILLNPNTKKNFYTDLDNLMGSLSYTVLASAIRKDKLKDQYTDPANPYMLSLEFLMERFLYFLEENNDVGYISVESRDPKSNTDLLAAFTETMNNGSYIIDTRYMSDKQIIPDRFQKRIQKMIFVTKHQNENGHQIADLIAYPIAKYAVDPNKDNPAFEIIKNKCRKNPQGQVSGYGLKIFPK